MYSDAANKRERLDANHLVPPRKVEVLRLFDTKMEYFDDITDKKCQERPLDRTFRAPFEWLANATQSRHTCKGAKGESGVFWIDDDHRFILSLCVDAKSVPLVFEERERDTQNFRRFTFNSFDGTAPSADHFTKPTDCK